MGRHDSSRVAPFDQVRVRVEVDVHFPEDGVGRLVELRIGKEAREPQGGED